MKITRSCGDRFAILINLIGRQIITPRRVRTAAVQRSSAGEIGARQEIPPVRGFSKPHIGSFLRCSVKGIKHQREITFAVVDICAVVTG